MIFNLCQITNNPFRVSILFSATLKKMTTQSTTKKGLETHVFICLKKSLNNQLFKWMFNFFMKTERGFTVSALHKILTINLCKSAIFT